DVQPAAEQRLGQQPTARAQPGARLPLRCDHDDGQPAAQRQHAEPEPAGAPAAAAAADGTFGMPVIARLTTLLRSWRGLFLVALIAGSLTGLVLLGAGASHRMVTARFRDADGLVVGNEVRVAGVSAGSVHAITVAVDAVTHRQ